MHKTKEQRRQEAMERQEKRNQRTWFMQLALLSKRSGTSAKETERLLRETGLC